MTRLIGLDIGEARIGVAISDATGLLASPYITLRTSQDETRTWTALQRLIEETEASGLVLGLPISLDGQLHAQGQRILAFAERLKQHIALPVTFWDERLSTVEAQRLVTERDLLVGKKSGRAVHSRRQARAKRRQNGPGIDALAAAVILQEYLDAQERKTENT